jgi:UDP-N-acetyl-D-glucosamine dehydrogenase
MSSIAARRETGRLDVARREAVAAALIERLESRAVRCAVIGLGFIGSTVAESLAEAGFDVRGFDRSPTALERLRASRTTVRGGLDPGVLRDAEVVVIAVRVLCGPGSPDVDLEPLQAAGATLARFSLTPRLIVLLSTLPPGTTRAFARRWAADDEVFVAHAPERLQVGDGPSELRGVPHLVGGIDASATRVATALIEAIAPTTVAVGAPEVSELSKLLENAFLVVGIGLVAELTSIAHATDVEAAAVTDAAATKPSGYHAFRPGAGIGGHCIPNDLQMLRLAARALGVSTPLLDGTAATVAEMPTVAVDRLERLLLERSSSLMGARVLIVGVGFKVGSTDRTATPAVPLVRELRRRGAVPVFVDAAEPAFEVDGRPVEQVEPDALAPDACYAAALVLAGDPRLAAERLRASAELVLDLGGARTLAGPTVGFARL